MVVRQPTGVNQRPAQPQVGQRAVVAEEATPTALVVDFGSVQGNVYGVGGGVVVGAEVRLLVRVIANDEVHGGSGWLRGKGNGNELVSN